MLLVVLIGFAAQAQLIQNGTMDGPGPLAEHWQINDISTPTLENGVQRVDSPFAAELFQSVQLGQGNYILNFDLQCSYYAQVMLYIDSINGYVISINPIPAGSMTHYSIAFSVYDTCIMIKWRTIPNYSTWLRLDNVTLTESFGVGIPDPVANDQAEDGAIYDLRGRRLSGRPQHGYYIMNRKPYYKN